MATSQGAARRKEQRFLESRRERSPAHPASSPPASRPWRNARLLSPATGRGGQLRQPREAKARSEGFHCLKVCKVFRIGARGNCHPLSLVAPQTTLGSMICYKDSQNLVMPLRSRLGFIPAEGYRLKSAAGKTQDTARRGQACASAPPSALSSASGSAWRCVKRRHPGRLTQVPARRVLAGDQSRAQD